MRYLIVLIACSLLFVQCGPDIEVHPTGSYDTLGVRWMTMERNNIVYYFQGTGKKGASIYADEHEDAYVTLDQVFKAKLPRKLRFFVWTDAADAEQRLGHPLGFAVPEECVTHQMYSQTLGHEMTHVLVHWAWGIEPTRYTRFVNEGVAVAFDLSGRDRIEMAKSALAGQNIQSVTDLWSGSYQAAPEKVFYPIAGAFMDFLYKKNMPDQFKALIKNQTQEDAENIYGKAQLDAMIKEFDGLVGLH